MDTIKLLGVDLSEYQRGISFARLIADGATFAILRGGDGGYNDKCFASFYNQAKEHNLPVGAYWFSRAVTANQAEQEALQFYSTCLKGRKFELPVYMDVECRAQMNLSRATLTEIVKVWTNTLKNLGYCVGVYSTANWLKNEMDYTAFEGVELWIAQWSTRRPSIPHGMWQFGGETNYLRDKKMAGYIVDQNYMYKDYPSLIKSAGENGYIKEDIDMTKEELNKLIDERIESILTGDGTEPSKWAEKELSEATAAGITDGTRPRGYATREEVAAMVLRGTKI